MEGLRRSSRSTKGQNSRLSRELELEREAAQPFNGVRKRKLDEDDGVRCICNGDGEGKMVECENCRTWQHIECMFGKDDESAVPEGYWCNDCKRTKSEGAQDVSDVSLKEATPVQQAEPEAEPNADAEPGETEPGDAEAQPEAKAEEASEKDNASEDSNSTDKKISDLEDKVRHSVANALYGILVKKAVPEALSAGKLNLGDKTGEQFAEALAMEIEGALYEHMAPKDTAPRRKKAKSGGDVGQKYRDKFRSLSFNLKDEKNPDLRLRIVTGQLTPEKIVTLSTEEMLNPELQKYADEVRKESIRDSVLKVEEMPRIRKTHKGEEVMDDEYEDENDHGERARERNSSDGEEENSSTNDSSHNASDNEEGGNQEERSAGQKRILMNANVYHASTAEDFTYSPPASPGAYDYEDDDTKHEAGSGHNEAHDDEDDDELERIIHGERINNAAATNEQEDDEDDDYDPEIGVVPAAAAAPAKPDHSASGIMDPGKTFWNGHVSFVGMSEFPGTARHLHSTSANLTVGNWDAVMKIHDPIVIDGRLDKAKAESYLRQISRSKDLAAYILTSDESEPKANYDVLFEYFHSRHKFGVIKNRLRNIRDAYILTIGPNDRIPDYLRLPEQTYDEIVARTMAGERLVVGLLVINQPIVPQQPRQPDVASRGFSQNDIGTLSSFLAQNPDAANSPQALLNLLQRNG